MMRIMSQEDRPLNGLLVIDFSQFLSGPLCGLKLADLGARVIKIERPGTGDLCRHLYISDTNIDDDNSLFHAINRNKESFSADLKNSDDCDKLRTLLSKADVMIQNFRPGVINKLGFGYEQIQKINASIIYASISGYGEEGPWRDLPGQDLLAQSRSGLLWLTGNKAHPPMPMGLAVADILAGNILTQGILAALVRRGVSGKGCQVETSLLEAMIDFQFEVLTTHLNDGHQLPKRSAVNGAHAYLGAPYGVYETSDTYLAIAMTPSLQTLAELIGCTQLVDFYDKDSATLFTRRDEIKTIIAKTIKQKSTNHWLDILQKADIWCSEVLNWSELMANEAFVRLDFIQDVVRSSTKNLKTVRAPLRMDSMVLKSSKAAPELGQHQHTIIKDLLSDDKKTE